MACKVCSRDAALVLLKEIGLKNNCNCLFSEISNIPIRHIMKADIVKYVFPAAEPYLKPHATVHAVQNANQDDGTQYVIRFPQRYGDKSPILLQARGLSFYPLHPTRSNFKEIAR